LSLDPKKDWLYLEETFKGFDFISQLKEASINNPDHTVRPDQWNQMPKTITGKHCACRSRIKRQ